MEVEGNMRSEELEKKLAGTKAEIEVLVERGESVLADIRTFISSAAMRWIDQEVPRIVRTHPDLVTQLGTERIGELKRRIEAMTAETPNFVARVTRDTDGMPHRRTDQLDDETSGEPYFAAVFRSAISRLGDVLADSGLLSSPAWQRRGDGYVCGINPGFDYRDHPGLVEYRELSRQRRELTSECAKLEVALKTTKAHELWQAS